MRLSEIYKILNLEFVGADMEISALNSLGRANVDELSYCDSEKNSKFIDESRAGAILVTSNLANLVKSRAVIVENPHLAFAILSKTFSKPLFYPKSPAVIDESVTIMPNVYIGNNVKIESRSIIMAGAYIGDNVTIGQDCIIHPNVVIYNDCKIGNECHINANSVIGSDGFGYAHTKTGEHIKIYHNGWVELEDNVEIGACTTIDRGVFEPTIVKKYSKIDNLVQIGHNCEIGFGCIIVSQTGLAGSTKLGRNVVMGGQSGTAGHLKIGDFAQIAGRGAVSKDLEPGKNYAGYPIMELKEWFKLQAKFLKEFGVKR
ncbi:UDP-3-O-(3-hydroxymyristoyl)glucosamine N-acyltransferase [Campylobacter fetus]|uniref:UDP-3-O-(3-hydroxymyristoyl)glucosamine N-acyltransferase n=1 Tax=Campylobacter fetus TaxID=196 RepID=UPI0005092478|nr:UDP-3-O-(3-hydroxymyristoyl)glucosamine N-acyltransferase [Campylobacter fetus]WKW18179.1 UDP-3-O-(3-hydroxymyristoyl)glucosamine N-acyltransferase [Campylobacter fetus subsp. fetus]AIR78738.1 UDP-3-O-(R-3-hydroxymyristoyl)-glucosamine N-acyltransferase [Campylobacter fetus subsp. fetus 04/554]EAJ5693049.1 UDP-3-O-(3-hydroxymyristoyl)glucosamine N-acyltransferase [Campylobacter fetus]EAJ5704597.1 UDP-3-O-(3-hydroxymyristoyl)glucosamine N-acyltransferase [Campylobacter fetus]EAJ9256203.1 UDP